MYTLAGHNDEVNAVAVTADGRAHDAGEALAVQPQADELLFGDGARSGAARSRYSGPAGRPGRLRSPWVTQYKPDYLGAPKLS